MDAPAPSPPVWSAQRRPSGAYLGFAGALALIFGVLGGGLMRLLQIDPSAWLPSLVGVGVALAFVATAARGCQASIDAAGVLRYGWGRRPALALDLRDVAAVESVHAGLLRGVGLAIAPERVQFLHRGGPTLRTMRRDRQRLGVDLVLEFLTAEDRDAIEAQRARLSCPTYPTPPSDDSEIVAG